MRGRLIYDDSWPLCCMLCGKGKRDVLGKARNRAETRLWINFSYVNLHWNRRPAVPDESWEPADPHAVRRGRHLHLGSLPEDRPQHSGNALAGQRPKRQSGRYNGCLHEERESGGLITLINVHLSTILVHYYNLVSQVNSSKKKLEEWRT